MPLMPAPSKHPCLADNSCEAGAHASHVVEHRAKGPKVVVDISLVAVGSLRSARKLHIPATGKGP